MKRVLLIVFILLTSISEAQTLFGIAQNPTTLMSYLASINSITGSVTALSSSITPWPTQSTSAIDPINKRYFFMSSINDTLTVVDLITGNVILQKRLSSSPTYTTACIEFNCMDTTLYSISINSVQCYLSKIDPVTASVTIISSSGFTGGPYASTLDPIKKRYYFMSNYDSIMSVSLVSGNIISKKKLSNSAAYDVASIEYNNLDTTLYALSTKITGWLNYLSKLNSFTGSVTITSPIGFGQNVCTGMSTLDPLGNKYFFNGCNDTLYCVNLTTGNLTSKPRFSNASVDAFWSIDFEQQLCSSPLNIQESENKSWIESIVIYPNPTSEILNIEKVEGYFESEIINCFGQSVLKSKNRNKLDVSKLEDGIYTLQLKNPQGLVAHKRLIIAR